MIRACLALLVLSLPAAAQQSVLSGLPPELAERIAARPDRFAATAIDLIHGQGAGGAITADGIETAIALDRAYFRARALRSFLECDLDADGTLTGAEVAARAATLSTPARARLLGDMAAADADADGRLGPAELAAHAAAAADRAKGPEDVALLRAILVFDADADGRVTPAEIRMATEALSTG